MAAAQAGSFLLLVASVACCCLWRAAGHCFQPIAQEGGQTEVPFDSIALGKMRAHFLANLNFAGTGAVLASPGKVPAQAHATDHYRFEWVRDGALSMSALLTVAACPEVGQAGTMSQITEGTVAQLMPRYLQRVATIMAKAGEADVHGLPRWTIWNPKGSETNWCYPQTDGPALRARVLLEYADRALTPPEEKAAAWALAKLDLDWLVDPAHILLPSCDIWEEDVAESKLLWNHVAMRRALHMGVQHAKANGDQVRAQNYEVSLERHLQNILSTHLRSGPHGIYVAECVGEDTPCIARGGDVDGAAILSLVHSGWLEGEPTSQGVANTVRTLSEEFCSKFPVNKMDTSLRIPGILFGRYTKDEYGGGNPWVLITASLASLLYQGAQAIINGNQLGADTLRVWQGTLWPSFSGSAEDFVTAGDAVLFRLKAHVFNDDFHLFEQIDKSSGRQYNAKDLTWSYAEVLLAMRERAQAQRLLGLAIRV